MPPSVSKESGETVLDGLYQQLLKRGVQYFLPSSHLEMIGRASYFLAQNSRSKPSVFIASEAGFVQGRTEMTGGPRSRSSAPQDCDAFAAAN
jgi:hypothetical protein